MKSNTVQVYSDGTCYWWRWLAVFLSLGMFYVLGMFTYGKTPAHSFHVLLIACGCLGIILAFVHRPHNYQLEVTDKELLLLKVPGGAVKRAFNKDDVKYVTIRNTGHLFGLAVLRVIVRTKQDGSKFYGPIYREGLDGVSASEIAQLLPRISREGLLTVKDTKSS